MSSLEIKGLYFWRQNHWLPCGLNLKDKLWWRFIPGVVIKVKWPKGPLVVDHNDPRWIDLGGAVWVSIDSADPNDHYRPELTELVGKQGIHWNWGMADTDVADNRLTIKIIKSKAKYASYFALKWA